MTLTLTILGCGSSGGVPRVGNDWGACDKANPRNSRSRCSLLASREGPNGTTRVLIDTSPDLRTQMLSAEVPRLDAVWFTHDHADHTHGIDDLRPFYLMQHERLPLFASASTMQSLQSRFAYCFADARDYPAIVEPREIISFNQITSQGAGGPVSAVPIPVQHGTIEALCFRFENAAAYMPDVNGLSTQAIAALQGLDLLIIDALRYKPHPSHYALDEALAVIENLKPKRAVITHMHIDLDYETLSKALPKGVIPAHDGLKLHMNEIT